MEDKQLNLNQPLLSVRRAETSWSSVPPPYKSELKSGPVRDQGLVPFGWEHSPGRPKHPSSPSQTFDDHKKPPIVPRLPPGRTSNADQQKGSESHTVITTSFSSSDGSGVAEDDDEGRDESSSGQDQEESFVDALDTISSTGESFLPNCSASSVAGRNRSRTFKTDPQARDFMIDRFLPAAVSMASEVPQCAPQKPSPVHELQPKHHLVPAAKAERRRPQLRYGPSFAHHYYQSHDYAEERSDEDEDDDDGSEYFPPKACGLIPRFCLKGSFFLMNPVPGMSRRSRIPMSPICGRMQMGSSSAGSCSGTDNERSTSDVSERKSIVGLITMKPHKNDNEFEDGLQMKSTQKMDDHNKLDCILASRYEPPPQSHAMKTRGEPRCHAITNRALNVDSNGKSPFFRSPHRGVNGSYIKETRQMKIEEFPIPPPLPMSPSESWLCRTLPSLSTKHSLLQRPYNLGKENLRNQPCNVSTGDSKWETMVKTTKVHHQHLRYSQELMLLAPIPETQ